MEQFNSTSYRSYRAEFCQGEAERNGSAPGGQKWKLLARKVLQPLREYNNDDEEDGK